MTGGRRSAYANTSTTIGADTATGEVVAREPPSIVPALACIFGVVTVVAVVRDEHRASKGKW
jgi:hypothetical protein